MPNKKPSQKALDLMEENSYGERTAYGHIHRGEKVKSSGEIRESISTSLEKSFVAVGF